MVRPSLATQPWCRAAILLGLLALPISAIAQRGTGDQTGLGTWTELAPMPITNAEAGAAAIGQRIFVAGGFNDETGLWIYDVRTDSWTRGADMPNGNHHPGVQAVDGKVYVIGGHDSESMVQIYDPATDRWSRGADLPLPTRAQATVVLDGRIHSIGGTLAAEGGGGKVEHTVYDPATDSWEILAPLLAAREHGYAAVIDGKIYFASGRVGAFIPQVDLQIYDPVRDRWSFGAPVIEPTSGHVVRAVGGRLYAIGGEQVRTETVLDLSQAYDPVRDEWTLVAPMPLRLHATANAVVDDAIYLLGGAAVVEASSTGLDRVFRFDPPIVQAPTKLRVRALRSGAIRLKWKFLPGKSDATEIEIEARRNGGRFRTEARLDPRTKKLVLDAPRPGTYTFRARSNGPSGTSAWSSEVSIDVAG